VSFDSKRQATGMRDVYQETQEKLEELRREILRVLRHDIMKEALPEFLKALTLVIGKRIYMRCPHGKWIWSREVVWAGDILEKRHRSWLNGWTKSLEVAETVDWKGVPVSGKWRIVGERGKELIMQVWCDDTMSWGKR